MRSSKWSLLVLCAFLPGGVAVKASTQSREVRPSALTPAPATPLSEVRRESLLNDLQVITLERADEPLVRCDLVIRSGAMFDLVGKVGLAAVTQESLLAANPRLKEELASLGAKIEWGVSWDATWFRIEAPPGTFGAAMEIFGRLLVVEKVRPDAFVAAHKAWLERVKARAVNLTPAERADLLFFNALYGDHPYGHNIEGTEKTIAAITYGDVYDFYKRFYLANNAFALVTGNIKPERVLTIFKAFFGGWVKGAIVPATFRQPKQTTTLQLLKIEASEVPAVEIRGGVVGVKNTEADFPVVKVLAQVLETRLRQDQANQSVGNLAVKAPARLLAGPVFISASVPAEQAADFSRRATESFAQLAQVAVSAEELAAAKAALTAAYAAQSVVEQLREVEMQGWPRNYPLTFASRINAVTAADLQRVAKRLLEANAMTVVILGRIIEERTSQD
jgi:zinc protease